MSTQREAMPAEVAALWPAPARARLGRKGGDGTLEYFVAPAARRPRVLVPRGVRGAERMFVRHGGGVPDRLVWEGWRRGHRWDVAGRLPLTRLIVDPDPDGIEAFLSDVVGERVSLGVLLGPPRANRKPVIQAFADSGRTVAFAKLGLSKLTRDLLSTEATGLTTVGATTTATFRAPGVLRHGEWKAMPILVQAALQSAQSRQAPVAPPLDAMVEIASLQGISTVDLRSSAFATSVAPDTSSDWSGIDVAALPRLYGRLADDARPMAMGCWHGDFGPWNMARGADGMLEVWDWERFETNVPVGLDAAHYRVQIALSEETDPASVWPVLLREVKAVLTATGADPSDAARAAGWYLLSICARYRHDAGDDPNPALRRRVTWLMAVADIAAARMEVSTS